MKKVENYKYKYFYSPRLKKFEKIDFSIPDHQELFNLTAQADVEYKRHTRVTIQTARRLRILLKDIFSVDKRFIRVDSQGSDLVLLCTNFEELNLENLVSNENFIINITNELKF